MVTEDDDGALPFTLDPDELIWHLMEYDGNYALEGLQRALTRVGRDHGPRVLATMEDTVGLPPRWASVLVPSVWSGVEHPLEALNRDTWRRLFDLAGYTHDGKRWGRPRKTRPLYRGADEAHRDGWSWSDDRAVAEWFAHRKPGGRVWVAQVEPSRLLARITTERPGESEYVVDPDGLIITEWTETR